MKIAIRKHSGSPVDPEEIDTAQLTSSQLEQLRDENRRYPEIHKAVEKAIADGDHRELLELGAADGGKTIDPQTLDLGALHKLLDRYVEDEGVALRIRSAIKRGRYRLQRAPDRPQGHWLLDAFLAPKAVAAVMQRARLQGYRADPLHGAALDRALLSLLEAGEEELAVQLIAAGIIDINAVRREDGATPLLVAVQVDADRATQALLEAGADREQRDLSGRAARELAGTRTRRVLALPRPTDSGLTTAQLLHRELRRLLLPTQWAAILAEQVGSARRFAENVVGLIEWYHAVLLGIHAKQRAELGPLLLLFRHLQLIRSALEDRELTTAANLKRMSRVAGLGAAIAEFRHGLGAAAAAVAAVLQRAERTAAGDAGLARADGAGDRALWHPHTFPGARYATISVAPSYSGGELRGLRLPQERAKLFERLRQGQAALDDLGVARLLAAAALAEQYPDRFGSIEPFVDTGVEGGKLGAFWDTRGHPWAYLAPASDSATGIAGLAAAIRARLARRLLVRGHKRIKDEEAKQAPLGVILDVTYLHPIDHRMMWSSLYDALDARQLARVVEVRVPMDVEAPRGIPVDKKNYCAPMWLDELASSPRPDTWGKERAAPQDLGIYSIALSKLADLWAGASSDLGRIRLRYLSESLLGEEVFEDPQALLPCSGLLLVYKPVGFDRRLDAERVRVVFSPRDDLFFLTATGGQCWYNYFHGYQRRNAFFMIDVDEDIQFRPTMRMGPVRE